MPNGTKKTEKIPYEWDWTKIVVAIIAAVATVLTVGGSIAVAVVTNNAQIEQQRFEEAREIKRTYYNQFIEAYTNKLQFVDKPNSPEKVQAEMNFALEVNRLPLYASQEMVEFVNSMWNSEKASLTSTNEFYDIMRRDLCTDEFLPFENLDEFNMAISNYVVITNPEGDKEIQ